MDQDRPWTPERISGESHLTGKEEKFMAAIAIGTLTDLEKSDYVAEGLAWAKPNLIYQQFGLGDRVAKRAGKTRQWFRMTKPGLAAGGTDFSTTVYQYIKNTTGTAPTWTPATPADTTVTAQVDFLFGQGHQWNDGVQYTSFADIPAELRKLNAQHASEAIEQEVINVLRVGTSVYYANNKAARNLITSVDTVDVDDILAVVTALRNNDAKPIRGNYRAMISANVLKQLLQDSTFREVVSRSSRDYYFTATIAEYLGLGFQFSSMAPTISNSGSNNAVTTLEQTIIVADMSYGITKWMLDDYDIVYTAPGGHGDEWSVTHALTWKFMFKSVILNNNWMYRLESAR